MTDFRQELHQLVHLPDFPQPALFKQAMARLDAPRRGGSHAWQVVVAAILVIALVVTFVEIRARRATLNPAGSTGWESADLPGTHSGFRAAAYDAVRDCLWIITKVPQQIGSTHDTVALTRMNIADRSTVSVLSMPATGYLNGFVAVDARGMVWMSWGKLLIEYNPDSKRVQSFGFPAASSVSHASSARTAVVHPEGSGTDGNAVAMTIGPDNEIWILVNSVQAVFGFNPATGTWDRFARVPLDPVFSSRLAAAGPERLVMSGVVIVHALYGDSYIAVIDTANGTSTVLPPKASSFSLVEGNTAVYAEPTGNLGEFNLAKVNLSNGSMTTLVAKAPIADPAAFVTDASGRVWFSMFGYWTIGIARLDPLTGALKSFPFPFVKHPGTPVPVISSCPSRTEAFSHCIPQYADPQDLYGNPEVQQLVIDKKGNVWVITAVAASDDPNAGGPRQAMPVMKLAPGN